MKYYWLRENREKGEWVSVIAGNDKMADVFEIDTGNNVSVLQKKIFSLALQNSTRVEK